MSLDSFFNMALEIAKALSLTRTFLSMLLLLIVSLLVLGASADRVSYFSSLYGAESDRDTIFAPHVGPVPQTKHRNGSIIARTYDDDLLKQVSPNDLATSFDFPLTQRLCTSPSTKGIAC